jgi:hypothetical protein
MKDPTYSSQRHSTGRYVHTHGDDTYTTPGKGVLIPFSASRARARFQRRISWATKMILRRYSFPLHRHRHRAFLTVYRVDRVPAF